jgi:hypothetical protein
MGFIFFVKEPPGLGYKTRTHVGYLRLSYAGVDARDLSWEQNKKPAISLRESPVFDRTFVQIFGCGGRI